MGLWHRRLLFIWSRFLHMGSFSRFSFISQHMDNYFILQFYLVNSFSFLHGYILPTLTQIRDPCLQSHNEILCNTPRKIIYMQWREWVCAIWWTHNESVPRIKGDDESNSVQMRSEQEATNPRQKDIKWFAPSSLGQMSGRMAESQISETSPSVQ